jgi:single-strand DNA-binding protein
MAELNKILLIGRLTKDPELRYTPAGTPVTQLRMAVNHTYRARDNKEKREEVLFIDVNVFGPGAETLKQYLSKGRELFVEGRLQQQDWQDKQGQKRTTFRVVADRWQFLGGRAPGEREAPAEDGGAQAEAEAAPTFEGGEAPAPPAQAQKEDDLPF